jgi:WD40 repeat protein
VASHENVQTFVGHLGTVYSVAFDPAADLISSVGTDHTVRLWDMALGKGIAQLRVSKEDNLTNVAFAEAGRLVVAVGQGGHGVREWDIGKRREGYTLYTRGPVAAVAFDSSGKLLAEAGQDSRVFVWNLENGSSRELPTVHRGAVWEVAFAADGTLATAGEDGFVRLWDVEHAELKRTLEPRIGEVYALALDPTGRYLAAGEFGGAKVSKVRIWNKDSGQVLSEIPHESGSVWSVAFSPVKQHYLAFGGNTDLEVCNVVDISAPKCNPPTALNLDEECRSTEQKRSDELYGMAFDNEGRYLATAGVSAVLEIRSIPSMDVVKCIPQTHLGQVNSLVFNHDGSLVVTGSSDNTVRLWDWRRDASTVLRNHERAVFMVDLDPTGKRLASGGIDHRITIWNLDQIQRVRTASPGVLLDEAQDDTCFKLDNKEHLEDGQLRAVECRSKDEPAKMTAH